MDALISPRRRSLVAGLASASLLAACGERRSLHAAPALEFRGPAMGSAYTLKIAGATGVAPAAAHEAVHDALQAIERLMSTYLADSELSRLNRAPAGTPYRAVRGHLRRARTRRRDRPGHGWRLRRHCRAARRRLGLRSVARPARRRRGRASRAARPHRAGTGSRSTPTGALPSRRARTCPPTCRRSPRATASTTRRARSTRSASPTTWSRRAARCARAAATPRARPGRSRSRRRTRGRRGRWFVVPLSDRSLATSGDYRIYFEQDGRRYCHEIDPDIGAAGRPRRWPRCRWSRRTARAPTRWPPR